MGNVVKQRVLGLILATAFAVSSLTVLSPVTKSNAFSIGEKAKERLLIAFTDTKVAIRNGFTLNRALMKPGETYVSEVTDITWTPGPNGQDSLRYTHSRTQTDAITLAAGPIYAPDGALLASMSNFLWSGWSQIDKITPRATEDEKIARAGARSLARAGYPHLQRNYVQVSNGDVGNWPQPHLDPRLAKWTQKAQPGSDFSQQDVLGPLLADLQAVEDIIRGFPAESFTQGAGTRFWVVDVISPTTGTESSFAISIATGLLRSVGKGDWWNDQQLVLLDETDKQPPPIRDPLTWKTFENLLTNPVLRPAVALNLRDEAVKVLKQVNTPANQRRTTAAFIGLVQAAAAQTLSRPDTLAPAARLTNTRNGVCVSVPLTTTEDIAGVLEVRERGKRKTPTATFAAGKALNSC